VRRAFLAGVTAIAPMLVGVAPFGLVAGATPVEYDLGGDAAVGLSTVVFAGASQLAAADVLGNGGSALLAALAAWTINLRLLLYSASIAPHLAHEPLRTRLGLAYLLTDQAYAVSIQRWSGVDADPPQRRVAYYLGAALCLWLTWQVTTVAGILVGPVVPDSVPLGFAVPLVFLVLLVPTVNTPPWRAARGPCSPPRGAPRSRRSSSAPWSASSPAASPRPPGTGRPPVEAGRSGEP
jgi:predicted branched-subunit amino acid permease